MSSLTFGLASARTLGKDARGKTGAATSLRSMFQTYIMIPEPLQSFFGSHPRHKGAIPFDR
jgi:hypothetical protein